MQVELRILRYDPEQDTSPTGRRTGSRPSRWTASSTCSTRSSDEQDGTLTFRRSCAHGVCGSDAMLINGRNRLACKIRVDQLGKKISVAPLPGLPVMKDLVVDMEGFFAKYRSVQPYLVRRRAAPGPRAAPVAGGSRALRRHHQVHPVRRLHGVVPVVLGPALVRRARRRS